MKAIVVDDDQQMHWQSVETPKPGADEVLIKVHAAGVNRADLMQRQGLYPPPPGESSIMGLECAGEIVEAGKNVSRWQAGDRVCALMAGGGYAEYAVVDAGSLARVPDSCGYVEAGSLPEVFATAWLNLFIEAGLKSGEKVVIHAGASGVGTAAIQLCRNFGNPCFVTAGSEDKVETCISLGAEGGSNRHDDNSLEKVREFAGDKGVDVILDPVGGAYLGDNLELLGIGGRLVLIGLMGGSKTEINLARLMIKRARVIGSTLRARPLQEKARVMADLAQYVWPLIEASKIRPIIHATLAIENAADAHDLLASNETVGKVVMTVG
ncbi:MAG: NAD(P)H-quinone oxidoreductase [Pseudomonadales bacterium]